MSSACLTSSITRLRLQQRLDDVQFLWLLAEIDARKAFAELGFGSLWDFCQQELRLTNGAAGRRIAAARLLREYPAAADFLADGRLGLTTFGMLRPILDASNHLELFAAASFKNEREVDELIRSRHPLAFVRDTIVRSIAAPPAATSNVSPASSHPGLAMTPPATGSTGLPSAQASSPPCPTAITPTAPPRMESTASVRAMDGAYVSLTLRVPKAFMTELSQLTAALSHSLPSARPGEILREAMRRTLTDLEKKRGGLPAPGNRRISGASTTAAPHESTTPGPVVTCTTATGTVSRDTSDGRSASRTEQAQEPSPPSASGLEGRLDGDQEPTRDPDAPARSLRRIPRSVARAVWRRDGGACSYVGPTGHRCLSTFQLEVHHRIPVAHGGPPVTENLALFCRMHNALAAEHDLGALFMSRFSTARSTKNPRQAISGDERARRASVSPQEPERSRQDH